MKTDRLPLLIKGTLVCAGIILAAPSFIEGNQQQFSRDGTQTEVASSPVDFRAVAKKAIPAVVSIKVTAKRKNIFGNDNAANDPNDLFNGGSDLWSLFGIPRRDSSRSQTLSGQASGVIVKPDGYVLTNSHVVHDMDTITVVLNDGREFPGKVLGEDPNSDLALVKIDAKDLPYLNLANSDELEVGQWVAAIGNPFGLQATLTAGVISAKGRNNLDVVPYEDFIQTDAAINRGNSGGPLVTLDGEIAGINTAIATNASSGYMGIGFAIPSNMAKRVSEEILADGKVSHGFIGVALQNVDYNLAKAFGLKKVEGALVTAVTKGSPAEKAGLQVEDVIIGYNDRPVENAAGLRNAVYMFKPGTKLNLRVIRKDKEINVPIELAEFNSSLAAAGPAIQTKIGIEVDNLTPELAHSLGYVQETGVVITKVAPNSTAALAGLKKGALIIAVNRQKVSNTKQFSEALKQSDEDSPVLLQVKQGDQYFFISLSG